MIQPVTPADRAAVAALWEPALGPFGAIWWRYWQTVAHGRPGAETWLWLPGQGFVYWSHRRDGWRTLQAVAVAPDHRRRGLGAQLVRLVGIPCRLTTDDTNAGALAFYARLDFATVSCHLSRDGRRRLITLERETPWT